MPAEESKNTPESKELLTWEIQEYHEHARGLFWAIGAAVAGILLLIYAIAVSNFLFAFIVLMFGIIFATHTLRPPLSYAVTITDKGLRLGERLYFWKDVNNFWIVDEPPAVKTLYLEFSGLRPRLPISLEEVDSQEVRNTLKQFISEDTSKTEEPVSDWIARVLKI